MYIVSFIIEELESSLHWRREEKDRQKADRPIECQRANSLGRERERESEMYSA